LITLFKAYFESITEWLPEALGLSGSFLMQYMAVGYSLFYYLLLVVVLVVALMKQWSWQMNVVYTKAINEWYFIFCQQVYVLLQG